MIFFWLQPEYSRPPIFKSHPYAAKLTLLLTWLAHWPQPTPTGHESWANLIPLGLSHNTSEKWVVVGRFPFALPSSVGCFRLLQRGLPACQSPPEFPELQIPPRAKGTCGFWLFFLPRHCTRHCTETEKTSLQLCHTWPSKVRDAMLHTPSLRSLISTATSTAIDYLETQESELVPDVRLGNREMKKVVILPYYPLRETSSFPFFLHANHSCNLRLWDQQ